MILALMLLLSGNPIASFEAAARRLPAEIPSERLEELDALAAEIAAGRNEVVFICTHNSRRSHLAQLWAQAAAFHCGLNNVRTYSGGTEATAFNPRTSAALQRMGWTVTTAEPETPNPRRWVSADGVPGQACWSKRYDDPANPQQHFIAVMTCTEADGACPVVFGAAARIALPYMDPKLADGTPEEAAVYDERSATIATEMLYVMQRAATLRAKP